MKAYMKTLPLLGISKAAFGRGIDYLVKKVHEDLGDADKPTPEQISNHFFVSELSFFVLAKDPKKRDAIFEVSFLDQKLSLTALETLVCRVYTQPSFYESRQSVVAHALKTMLGFSFDESLRSYEFYRWILEQYFCKEAISQAEHSFLSKRQDDEIKETQKVLNSAEVKKSKKILEELGLSYQAYTGAVKQTTLWEKRSSLGALGNNEDEVYDIIFPLFESFAYAYKDPLGCKGQKSPQLVQGNLTNLSFLMMDLSLLEAGVGKRMKKDDLESIFRNNGIVYAALSGKTLPGEIKDSSSLFAFLCVIFPQEVLLPVLAEVEQALGFSKLDNPSPHNTGE